MPGADGHFLPGQLWHITHRCHEKAFLLKFPRDRRRYLCWLRLSVVRTEMAEMEM